MRAVSNLAAAACAAAPRGAHVHNVMCARVRRLETRPICTHDVLLSEPPRPPLRRMAACCSTRRSRSSGGTARCAISRMAALCSVRARARAPGALCMSIGASHAAVPCFVCVRSNVSRLTTVIAGGARFGWRHRRMFPHPLPRFSCGVRASASWFRTRWQRNCQALVLPQRKLVHGCTAAFVRHKAKHL